MSVSMKVLMEWKVGISAASGLKSFKSENLHPIELCQPRNDFKYSTTIEPCRDYEILS